MISQYRVVIPGELITSGLWNGMEQNIINNGLIPSGVSSQSETTDNFLETKSPYDGDTVRPENLKEEILGIRDVLDQVQGGNGWHKPPVYGLNVYPSHSHAETEATKISGLVDYSVTTQKLSSLMGEVFGINSIISDKINLTIPSSKAFVEDAFSNVKYSLNGQDLDSTQIDGVGAGPGPNGVIKRVSPLFDITTTGGPLIFFGVIYKDSGAITFPIGTYENPTFCRTLESGPIYYTGIELFKAYTGVATGGVPDLSTCLAFDHPPAGLNRYHISYWFYYRTVFGSSEWVKRVVNPYPHPLRMIAIELKR